jgi:N-acetyl-beta-hexosaminidase
MKRIDALKRVQIELGGKTVVAWEAKDPALRLLGRWTDPKALLRRIYELEHPEENAPEGPGRQWQATWRGRFSGAPRSKSRKAA